METAGLVIPEPSPYMQEIKDRRRVKIGICDSFMDFRHSLLAHAANSAANNPLSTLLA